MVFEEIMPHALSLMTDVFGNYVVQKVFFRKLKVLSVRMRILIVSPFSPNMFQG